MHVSNAGGGVVSAGLALLKWVIRWEKVGHAHACLSCIS